MRSRRAERVRGSITWGAVCVGLISSCSTPKDSPQVGSRHEASAVVREVRGRFHPAGSPLLGPSGLEVLPGIDGPTATGTLAAMRYPKLASEHVTITETRSGLSARVRPQHARATAGEIVDGLVVYRDAFGEGASLFHRPTPAGTEDFVLLPRRPTTPSVAFDLELGERVKGLRLVGNSLELLDATGTPGLHVSPPWIVGADGKVAEATLSVEGCAFDAEGTPPWGRAVTTPGASSCTVRVSWNAEGIVYPALLDPAWTSAGTFATPRVDAAIAGCNAPSQKIVLFAGGTATATSTVLSSSETYDASTNTFAATNSMVNPRKQAAAAASGSSIYVAGGMTTTVVKPTEAWYCPHVTTFGGTWYSRGNLNTGRIRHGMVAANSQLVVFGGTDTAGTVLGSFETNQETTFWNQTSNTLVARADAGAFRTTVAPAAACVVAAGGRSTSTGAPLATTAVFCPGGGTDFTAGPTMVNARAGFGVAAISNGKWLLVGGTGTSGALSTTEEYSGSFVAGTPLPEARAGVLAASIGDPATATVPILAVSPGTTLPSLLLSGGVWAPAGNTLDHSTGFALASLPTVSGALVVGSPSAPERWTRMADGSACTGAGECTSGFCVDGFCCKSACNGTCQACSNVLTGSANGTCANTKAGGDSKSKCGATSASSCGDDGTCDGAGACRKWVNGTVCQAASCASSTVQNNTRTCNGMGTCQAVTTTTCTAPYVCTSLGTGDGCATSCTGTDDTKCAPGFFCNGSACVSALTKATACTRDRQCASGFCADGVCCSSRCGGNCEACTAAFKKTGADGDCGNVPADSDPRDKCAKDSGYPASCKADGMCDGAGACRSFAVAGVECASPTCTAGKASTSKCDGGGVCALTEKSCAPDSCNPTGTACAGSCGKDSDCASTAFCDATTSKCTPKKTNGEGAKDARECTSGIVADGVCCNDVCDGICEACDGSATKGTCTAVAGKARHGSCPAGSSDAPCSAASCDGTERKSCVAKAGADLVCAAPSCTKGVETIETRCDGSGTCPTPATKNCTPYACDTSACKTKCTVNGDCADGFFCDPGSGVCGAGASCIDDKTLKRSDGTTETCVGFKCSGQGCLKTCTSTNDCQSGFVCNNSNNQCEAAPSGDSGDDGGCTYGASSRSAPALLSLALATLLLRKRRR